MKKNTNRDGCEEYRATMSRRKFMGISTAAAAAVGLPAWFPATKMADPELACQYRCTLIKFFARGGWDGLSICVPYADGEYYNLRPLTGTIAYAPPGDLTYPERACLDLDGFFGWPQIMQPLKDSAWANNHLAIVNAVGLETMHSFSHFVQQYRMEALPETASSNETTGWVGRHLDTRQVPDPCNPVIRGLGLRVSPQQVLVGGPDVIATSDPDNYDLRGDMTTINQRLDLLKQMYINEGTFGTEVQLLSDYIDELKMVDWTGYVPSVTYPTHLLGQQMLAIAKMIDSGINIEAYGVDFGGWDTHSDQDPHNLSANPRMWGRLKEMSEAFTAFYQDLTAKNHINWVLYAVSEFGRTARENANLGTDHGKGNCMLAIGPQVNGGIYGTVADGGWPGLSHSEVQNQNHLPIFREIRDVVAELVHDCLANSVNLATVLPGYTPPSTYPGIFA